MIAVMSEGEFEKLTRKARRRNTTMDTGDRKGGFAAPPDCSPDSQLRTVLSAIKCGVQTYDWDAVLEGYALLQDIEEKFRAGGFSEFSSRR